MSRKSYYDSATSREEVLNKLRAAFQKDSITLKQLNAFFHNKKNGVEKFPHFIVRERKIARGVFSITANAPVAAAKQKAPKVSVADAAPAMAATVINLASRRATNTTESFVPEKNTTYVPFGFFNDMKNIIKSGIFYPIYITGLSGNGKTFMIEQVCAALNRELIRVNITKRTDETDLIGSYELIDGNTVRREIGRAHV